MSTIVCPHCGKPWPEPPLPPEVAEAMRQWRAQTAKLIGAEVQAEKEK